MSSQIPGLAQDAPAMQAPLTPATELDVMSSALDQFRPDPAIVDEYLPREFASVRRSAAVMTDVELMLSFYKRKQNVLLKGDTQGGKSMLTQVVAVAAARARGLPKPLPVFTLSGSGGITDFDLFGQITAYVDPDTKAESLVRVRGLVELAALVGGILELDEVTMMPERATASLHSLLDGRRQFTLRSAAMQAGKGMYLPTVIKAHPDFWCIGSYNEGYRGNVALQDAFANRFSHMVWDYDPVVEGQLLRYSATKMLLDGIRSLRTDGVISTPVGVTAFRALEDNIDAIGEVLAIESFVSMFPTLERTVARQCVESSGFFNLIEADKMSVGGLGDAFNQVV